MKLQYTPRTLHAAHAAAHTQAGRDLAAQVVKELRALISVSGPASVIALAMSLAPGGSARDALRDLAAKIGQVKDFAAGLQTAFDAERMLAKPAFDLIAARKAEIQVEISNADAKLRATLDAITKPMERWSRWASMGLTRDEILAKGIPEPEVSGDSEVRDRTNVAHAEHQSVVSELMSEQAALGLFERTLNPALLPLGFLTELRKAWASPLDGHARLLEGLQ